MCNKFIISILFENKKNRMQNESSLPEVASESLAQPFASPHSAEGVDDSDALSPDSDAKLQGSKARTQTASPDKTAYQCEYKIEIGSNWRVGKLASRLRNGCSDI